MQSEDLKMSGAWAYFDCVLGTYLMLATTLKADARIVINPQSEAGSPKIQNKQADA